MLKSDERGVGECAVGGAGVARPSLKAPVAAIAGKTITKEYDLTKPVGVRGRNSNNDRLRQVLGWDPSVSLRDGLTTTYAWIHEELRKCGRLAETEANAPMA